MAAVAHSPTSLDHGPLQRWRRPLSALAATILVIDLMGLGMHLADSAESPIANEAPTHARTRIAGPQAVVPNTDVAGVSANRTSAHAAQPLGCLAVNSGCYAGPPPPANSGAGTGTGTTTPPAGGNHTTPTTAPKPLVQANVGVPALATNAAVGVGDGGCTGLNLTVLAVGDCPAPGGSGPLQIKLGGTLLGGS